MATLHNLKLPLPTEYTEATNYENIQLQLNANKPKKNQPKKLLKMAKVIKINFSDFLIHYEAMKMYETEDTLFIENFRHNKPSHQAELTQKFHSSKHITTSYFTIRWLLKKRYKNHWFIHLSSKDTTLTFIAFRLR
ncbi:MAG: hypothetical protein HWD59_10325 [Coxiellaceae bacterium]|nr:MAG: hypothetical protein HWD59_10325 [Coxiellaceae bacterium]